MSTNFSFSALPPDPLLGLMEKFRADTRPHKVDLGVGVYRDDEGVTPILQSVRFAEERRILLDQTKAYEGPKGNADFCAALESLVFGDVSDTLQKRSTSLATPGGCGALYLAIQVAKRATDSPDVWIGAPSWSNHAHMAREAGLSVRTYGYRDQITGALDFRSLIEDLRNAKKGDLVIVQGPCHNPSGIDLNLEQWQAVGSLCDEIGFLPLVDIAYHGLGDGVDEDMAGVREFLRAREEALIAYSCSKNFGLYRERTGGMISLAQTFQQANAIGTHLADISRATYSMPPSHGAAIVSTIIKDRDLTNIWLDELEHMRERIKALRSELSEALADTMQSERFARLEREKGMFSLLPLNKGQAARLADEFGIYVPGSGRINIAGLNSDNIPQVADAVRSVLC